MSTNESGTMMTNDITSQQAIETQHCGYCGKPVREGEVHGLSISLSRDGIQLHGFELANLIDHKLIPLTDEIKDK